MKTDKTRQTVSALPEKARWQYSGDVNIEHGGTFFDLSDWNDGYVNAIRVTDLDGACGFDGAVMIEEVSIIIDNDEQNKRALECCGLDADDIGRLQLADSVLSYGYFDTHGIPETIQTQSDGPMSFDGWKADKRISTDDLRGYIVNKYDCEVQP